MIYLTLVGFFVAMVMEMEVNDLELKVGGIVRIL